MNKTYLAVLAATVLAMGCGKNDGTSEKGGDASRFDIKGVHVGDAKRHVESVFGVMACVKGAEAADSIPRIIKDGERLAAHYEEQGWKYGESPLGPGRTGESPSPFSASGAMPQGAPTEGKKAVSPTEEEMALINAAMSLRKEKHINVMIDMVKERIDELCAIEARDGDQAKATFANRPVTLEVGFRRGKLDYLNLDVMNADTSEIARGIAMKYGFLAGDEEGMPGNLKNMQAMYSLFAGIKDKHGTTLLVTNSPQAPNVARIQLLGKDYFETLQRLTAAAEKKKMGAEDM